MMSYEKLRKFLVTLFQFNRTDEDSGIVRIMRSKSEEIVDFLTNGLPYEVNTAVAENTPRFADEVYQYVHAFFRRYYREGPSSTKMTCKSSPRPICSHDQEVTLSWAYRDQYYVRDASEACGRPTQGRGSGPRSSATACDFFIHKDLEGFLTRELDAYLSNELIALEDGEDVTGAPQRCREKIKAVRRIARKIISFLAESEEVQKRLWLKKKLVLSAHYCLTLDRIPRHLYQEIAANRNQREEWVRLFAIDDLQDYTVPLTLDFLQARPFLMIDTKFFPEAFKWKLTSEMKDLSASSNGLLICGEAFQAMRLMRKTCEAGIDFIIIDPPYNTGSYGFAYKDKFRHSSWLTMMENCLSECAGLLKPDGIFAATIDDNELHHLGILLNAVFGESNRAACAPWISEPSGGKEKTGLRTGHEYVLIYHNGDPSAISQDTRSTGKLNLCDKHGPYRKGRELRKWGGISARSDRPNQWYPLKAPDGEEVYPIKNDGSEGHWRWGKTNEFIKAALRDPDLFHWEKCPFNKGVTHLGMAQRWVPFEKLRTTQKFVGWSTWLDSHGSNADGTRTLKDLFGKKVFDTPKPTQLYKWILSLHHNREGCVLDFFSGSGTTAHAVIDLNREDGGSRKYVLVETEDHFDRILKSRIQKVVYSKDWKNGKPASLTTGISHMFKYVRIESYRDCLNNLETGPGQAEEEIRRAEREKDQTSLRYRIHNGSGQAASRMNVCEFAEFAGYTLRIKRRSSRESSVTAVDLLETFDYLIGLNVTVMTRPESFTAEFERDSDGKLTIKGGLRADVNGLWRFRSIIGATPQGSPTLVIWRTLTGRRIEDLLAFDAWLGRRGYDAAKPGFRTVYVNGACDVSRMKNIPASSKMHVLEEEFFHLLWNSED